MKTRRKPSMMDIAKERGIQSGVGLAGQEIGRQLHPDIKVVGELPNGNVEMSDGSILDSSGEVVKSGSLAGKMKEYGGYAAAAYQLYKAMKSKDRTQQVLGSAGAANTAAQAGGLIGSGAGAGIGAAIGAVGIGMSDADAKAKAKATRRLAEDTGLGVATGGVSGLVQVADQALLGGKINSARNKLDKVMDSPIGMIINPIGFANNKLTDKVLEKGFSMFGSGKGEDQVRRDAIRKMMQEQGMFGGSKDDWTLENADGSSFDVGKDGGARLEDGRRYFDVNTEKQGAAIGSVNPLAYLMTGGNKQLATDMAGYLTNTITQGKGASDAATANLNALDKYKKAGFDTMDKASAGVDEMLKAGKIDQATADAFKGGLRTVYGASAPPSTTQPSTTGSNRLQQLQPKDPVKPKPIKTPKLPVSMADIAPMFTKPMVMPEPDNAPSQTEMGNVANYRQQLEELLRGGLR
jgi:hypothetical protein